MASAVQTPPSPWIVNPAVDLIIGCGAWTIPLLALATLVDQSGIIAVSIIFYFLTVFCNNPHYFATIHRAYGTREDFNKYRFFTVYVTVAVVLTGILAHWSPMVLPWLFTIYITWSPWHYTAQNFGIAMMFARRGGAQPAPAVRNALQRAHIASYAMWFLAVHAALSENPYFRTLGIDDRLALGGGIFALIVFAAAGGWALWRLTQQAGPRALLPVYALFATQACWFVIPVSLQLFDLQSAAPVYFSTGALAFMHCAQYLWITNYTARREAQSRGTAIWRPLRYYGLMIAGGIALFLPGPWVISRVLQFNLVESYLIFTSLINIHHFILDGAIWKLRDGRLAALLLGKGNAPAGAGFSPLGWLAGASLPARGVRYAAGGVLIGLAVLDQAQFVWTSNDSSAPEIVERALSLNPSDGRVWLLQARAALDAGDREAAQQAFERALELRGLNVSARRLQASTLLETGDIEAAWAEYLRLEEMVRPDLPTLVNVGVLAASRGERDLARQRLEAAALADPNRPDVQLNLGELAFEGQRFADAIGHYAAYLRLQGDLAQAPPAVQQQAAEVSLRLAEALAQEDRPQDAADFYARAAQGFAAVEEPVRAAAALDRLRAHHAEARNFPAAVAAARAALDLTRDADPALHGVYLFQYAALLADGRGMLREAYALMLSYPFGPTQDPAQDAARAFLEQLEKDLGAQTAAEVRAQAQAVREKAFGIGTRDQAPGIRGE